MWNSLEIAKLALQGAALIVAGFGLRQFNVAVAAYRDLHDWNRRKAAQDAVDRYKDIQDDNLVLHTHFNVMESAAELELRQVEALCSQDPLIRKAVHRRLNYFEALATGCKQGVYDEDVIRIALESLFRRSLGQFRAYIVHRRNVGAKDLWIEFEALSNRWSNGVSPARKRLGTSV